MNRWVLFGLIVGSTIAIGFPVYHYRHVLNQPLIGNYLFAGLVIEGIVIFLVQNHIEGKRRVEDRKQKHTMDLNHIYLRLTDFGFKEEKKQLVLTFPKDYTPFRDYGKRLEEILDRNYDPQLHSISKEYFYMYEDYYYFDYAIKHLKHRSYKNIYEHWEKINNIIDEHNNSPKFVDKLAETIKTKIQIAFPEFKDVHSKRGEKDDIYRPREIFEFISAVIKNEKGDDYIEFLKIDKSGDGEYSVCTGNCYFYGQLSSMDENKIDLDKYKLTIKSIIQEKEVQQSLELDTKRRLELISEQRKFSEELEVLIKKLKAGSIIEGKCEGCSTF